MGDGGAGSHGSLWPVVLLLSCQRTTALVFVVLPVVEGGRCGCPWSALHSGSEPPPLAGVFLVLVLVF